MKALILIIVIVVLGLFAIWFFDTNPNDEALLLPPNGALTKRGTLVCLPHRDTNGPTTMECAYGLFGDDQYYYKLIDESATSAPSAIINLPINTYVEAVGVFTRGEDPVYDTVGTLSVTSINSFGSTDGETNGTTAPRNAHSDGIITFSVPDDFGLATNSEQLVVGSVVPPCAPPFAYCLYYLGDAYENTNFESAGVSVATRENETDAESCLSTPPDGYTSLEPTATSSGQNYAISVFSPLQDAATGHYSNGAEYRLSTKSTCYAFRTQVGESQFENRATTTLGTTTEFAASERNSMLNTLHNILRSITLDETNEKIVLPEWNT